MHLLLGPVAQSDACPTGSQVVAGSMLLSSTIFLLRLIMVILYLPLIQEGQLSLTGEKNEHFVLVTCLVGLSLPRKKSG